mgnify:CR=1 FL=1|tara:strand:+ start:536 stop:652 length:117 start_codon:yes stop_codon:yes gene_type:complete
MKEERLEIQPSKISNVIALLKMIMAMLLISLVAVVMVA